MRLPTRASLEKILRRKVRLKITKRKRGRFTLTIPAVLNTKMPRLDLPNKRQALSMLAIQLRCMPEIVIEITGAKR